MNIQKQKVYLQFTDKDNDFSKSVNNWLAQYDEEDDFQYMNASNALSEIN